jgi:stage II sporulation protein D
MRVLQRSVLFLSAVVLAVTVWFPIPANAGPGRKFSERDDSILKMARKAGQGDPLLRIGLPPSQKILVASKGEFKILNATTLEPVWENAYSDEIAVVVEGAPEGPVGKLYRIQVGAFNSNQTAEQERARLSARYGVDGVVHHVPDRGSYRVRLGASQDRQRLSPLLDRMRADGMEGLWISEEPRQAITAATLRLVNTGTYASVATDLSRLVVVPVSARPVQVEGVGYKGVVELRIDAYGKIRPVNWVELETYLRGVVPAELGPEVWPEIEALKAQAVAARTYVWKNLGQFADDGYDLCATPRCQVYKGAPAEHPLSDRAIQATSGRILLWDNKPISALYTATCGGHTEDAVEIFPEEDAPYLKGVPCRAEEDALRTHSGTLAGRKMQAIRTGTGTGVTREWALLAASGVVDWAGQEAAGQVLTARDLLGWADRLATLTGRHEAARTALDPSAGSFRSLGEAAEALVESLGWGERPEVLLETEDIEAVLRDPDAASLPLSQRRALAYLALSEGLAPFPDGSYKVGDPPTRGRVLPVLVKVGEAYDGFDLKSGRVASLKGRQLRMVRGKGEVRLQVGDKPYLFGRSGGRVVPVQSLELWPGDQVRYRVGADGHIAFLELLPPVKGVSDDRSSSVYSWELRKSRRKVENAINRRVAIGTLQNLKALRRGVSGRIVELEVTGTRATTVVKGFDLRNLLGLRESLAVIEIQRDAAGQVDSVVFAGKGWGHGVGLCQVGAYGMAVRGKNFKEILAHYYQGATLGKL